MEDNDVGSAEKCFSLFCDTLRRRYGNSVFKLWFSDLRLDDCGGDAIILSTESDLRRDRLDQQYKPGLMSAWSDNVYPIRRVTIIKRANLSSNAARVNALAPQRESAADGAHLGVIVNGFDRGEGKSGSPARRAPRVSEIATALDQRLTFDTFAVDASNEVAVAAARQIFNEEAPREIIYFHGPSATGKSHLLHACGNEWMARYPMGRAVYVTHNNIQNGCVGALLSSSTMSFHRDVLANDLVMIDDIHMLAGKKGTLDELVNLVNSIVSAGRQVIIAGGMSPGKLVESGFPERLADRLAGGLSVRISPASEKLRAEVLMKHRAAAGLDDRITDETISLTARLFSASMRDSIGAFKTLALRCRTRPGVIGPAEALSELQSRLNERRRKATLEETLSAAADAFGINAEELLGRSQPQRIVRARHAFVYVARTVLFESFPRIGRALGRDHTTAISSMRRAEALMPRDKAFAAGVGAIKVSIGAEFEPEKLLPSKAS
ncbi:MAG: DnaA/Hda family protein [Parvularculaceae bacterium]